jgi:hypothetical protein
VFASHSVRSTEGSKPLRTPFDLAAVIIFASVLCCARVGGRSRQALGNVLV